MLRRLGSVIVITTLATIMMSGTTAASPPQHMAEQFASSAVVVDIAHRGASGYAPENTIAGFQLATKQHADMFELDVQESRDHQLVVMHDTTLARTTNVEEIFPDRAPWNVSDFTLSEIRKLDAGSWFSPKYAGEPVPTLGETLLAMRGSGLGLLLEIKSPELYPGIERRIATELRSKDAWLVPDPRERRLVVESFNWDSMRRFHSIMPGVPIGLLGAPAVPKLPELASFADQINPEYVDLTPEYVQDVHGLGMEVFTWTVNDIATMRNLIFYGVDGIITNKPDVGHEVIDAAVLPAS